MAKLAPNWMDRVALAISPSWGLNRVRSRAAANALVRHYDAASAERRTWGWPQQHSDANAAIRPALHLLRVHARDLVRNNGWARNALRVIGRNTIGWGLVPKARSGNVAAIQELWKDWAETTLCDAAGRQTIYGIQRQVIRTVAEAGEVLIRRRWRRPEDGLPIPLQLQVLEADFLDTAKDGLVNADTGGTIIQGVEFDKLGRRSAYWLFEEHPGATRLRNTFVSKRVPASEILHVLEPERPGQVRGVSWLAVAILKLKDFDEYDDATLMKQKIAACFSAFVSDPQGTAELLGVDEEDPEDPRAETLDPGLITYLRPGEQVQFATPPSTTDHESFSKTNLRSIAAGVGVTYEDLTGDYSNVNFSSGRMGRIAHWENVHDWRWNLVVPLFCDPVWRWMMEAAMVQGLVAEPVGAEWTPPPMPMLEPDKEGLALQRLVRSGALTHDAMIRQQGMDPEEHWKGYAAGLKRLDELGIVLDSDARKVSQTGQTQQKPAAAGAGASADGGAAGDEEEEGDEEKSRALEVAETDLLRELTKQLADGE